MADTERLEEKTSLNGENLIGRWLPLTESMPATQENKEFILKESDRLRRNGLKAIALNRLDGTLMLYRQITEKDLVDNMGNERSNSDEWMREMKSFSIAFPSGIEIR